MGGWVGRTHLDDGVVHVGSHSAGRPLGVLFPNAFLRNGSQTDGLPRAELNDTDAWRGGWVGGWVGGMSYWTPWVGGWMGGGRRDG